MKKKPRFILVLLVAAAAMCAVILVLNLTGVIVIPPIGYALVVGYGLLTFVLYKSILSSTRKNPKRFVAAVMGSVSIKLFVSAIFMAIYAYSKSPNRIEIALTLFAIYACYTALLTGQVNRELRSVA